MCLVPQLKGNYMLIFYVLVFKFEIFQLFSSLIVSESDILGPIDCFRDIENLVSFERAMFEDYSFKHKMKIFLFFMFQSPRRSACL